MLYYYLLKYKNWKGGVVRNIATTHLLDKIAQGFGEECYEVEKISYEDGLKLYFTNGGWIIARFSGTEPLLRVFTEMSTEAAATEVSNKMKAFLNM